MTYVRKDFFERKDQLSAFLDLVSKFEKSAFLLHEGETHNIPSITLNSLKSGFVLMLYNLMEATLTNCLEEIHNSFSEKNYKYNDLSEPLQKLWLSYQIKKSSGDDKKNHIHAFYNSLYFESEIVFSYSDYTNKKQNPPFSGNVDLDELNHMAKLYGLNLEIEKNTFEKELKKIKERRNKLAHGELSFDESGRTLSAPYLNVLRKKSVIAMYILIKTTEEYLKKQKYLNESFLHKQKRKNFKAILKSTFLKIVKL